MGASALLTLFLGDWETPAKILIVTMLFAAGAALAFPIGLFAARLVSQEDAGKSLSPPPSCA